MLVIVLLFLISPCSWRAARAGVKPMLPLITKGKVPLLQSTSLLFLSTLYLCICLVACLAKADRALSSLIGQCWQRYLTGASSPLLDEGKCFFHLELENDPHRSPLPKILAVSLQEMLKLYHASDWLMPQYGAFIYRCV